MPTITPAARRAAALAALAGANPRRPHPAHPMRADIPSYQKLNHAGVIWRQCKKKASYRTEADARRAAASAAAARGVELRVYQCDFCHHFHLTKYAPSAYHGNVKKPRNHALTVNLLNPNHFHSKKRHHA